MIFLITGGSSFIGVALTELLVKEGHSVYVVCRRTSKTKSDIPVNSKVKTIYYTGLDDITSVCGQVSCVDVFIHLAWDGTGHEGRDNKEIQNDNIRYSLVAFDIAHKLKCRLFVEAGSQAEYGNMNGLITEDTICNPENEYGKAKLEFGHIASGNCILMGMKFIHLRIFSLFGETDHPWTLVMSSIRKMLKNEDVKLSSCEQLWNFLYVKDAVKQIYLLCKSAVMSDNFSSEIYNIASQDTRKLRDFVEEMYRLTESKSNLIFGGYVPSNVVSLNPSVEKTKVATGGFISEYSFAQVINNMIDNYKEI